MTNDRLQYDRFLEEAKHGVMRKVLRIVAEHGVQGGQPFYLTFRTDNPGVELPDSLRARYPKEMTIDLRHTFWDLEVLEDYFSVVLSFKGDRRTLVIPFEALLIFQDRSFGFALQFQDWVAPDVDTTGDTTEDSGREEVSEKPVEAEEAGPDGGEESPAGAEDDKVVTLDTFRKK